MTHRDLEILIDCVEDAKRTKSQAACTIADCIMYGKMPTDAQVKAYTLACMAVKSTTRDLENCMEIAAVDAAEGA